MAQLAGRPLVDHAIAAGVDAGLAPVVVAKAGTALPEDLTGRGVYVLIEPDRPQHLLMGVVSALEAIGEPLVVCACDMPFVPAPLLAELALRDEAAVVCPSVGGHLQPALARYSPGALQMLRAAAENGDSARAALERAGAALLDREWLARFGDPERILADIDTPGDLTGAELTD